MRFSRKTDLLRMNAREVLDILITQTDKWVLSTRDVQQLEAAEVALHKACAGMQEYISLISTRLAFRPSMSVTQSESKTFRQIPLSE